MFCFTDVSGEPAFSRWLRTWTLSKMASEKVLRISQLDALELDGDLTNVIQEKFFAIFEFLPSVSLLENLKPELKVILRYLIWKWSLASSRGCTFGQEMMSLKYTHSSTGSTTLTTRQKYLLLFMSVFPSWCSDRLIGISDIFIPPTLRVDKLINFLKAFLQFCTFINFCCFLLNGLYPSLKERLLKIEMVPRRPQVLRQLTFQFMNREIIWYGFSEFLFSVLPLMNFSPLRNLCHKVVHNLIPQRERVADINRCVYCDDMSVLPQISSCGHVFCYYCISANVLADSNFPCPLCNESVLPFDHKINVRS